MWHLGLRKEKDVIALVIVFIALGIMITIIANQCGIFSCGVGPAGQDQGLVDSFDIK